MKHSHFAILSILISVASTLASPLEARAVTVTKTKTKTVTHTKAPVTTTKTKTKTITSTKTKQSTSTVTAACSSPSSPSSGPSNPSNNICGVNGSEDQVHNAYLDPTFQVLAGRNMLDCSETCSRNDDVCKSWAYDYTQGYCAIFNDSVSKLGLGSSSSGNYVFYDEGCTPNFTPTRIKPGTEEAAGYQPQCMQVVSDVYAKSVGYDVQDRQMTIEKCQKSCQQGISGDGSLDYKCQSYVFSTNPTTGLEFNSNCKLFFKSAAEVLNDYAAEGSGTIVNDVGCDISSQRTSWTAPPYQADPAGSPCEFTGDDYNEVDTARPMRLLNENTQDGCLSACQTTPNCISYAFSQNYIFCYLHNASIAKFVSTAPNQAPNYIYKNLNCQS